VIIDCGDCEHNDGTCVSPTGRVMCRGYSKGAVAPAQRATNSAIVPCNHEYGEPCTAGATCRKCGHTVMKW
jgi:hypothetical protein